MVTYLYWLAVFAIAAGLIYVIGQRMEEWKISMVAAVSVIIVGYLAYHFHYEQVFVKRYGGVMTVKVPEGEVHLAATWKDDNLWIENYNPEKNTCYFREYSRGNMLQGQVTIKNCNPMLRRTPELPASSGQLQPIRSNQSE